MKRNMLTISLDSNTAIDACWHMSFHPRMGKFLRISAGRQENLTIHRDAFQAKHGTRGFFAR